MRQAAIAAIEDRLRTLLHDARQHPDCTPLIRLSVALFNERDNTLHAMAAALNGVDPLSDYQAHMDEVPSLAIMAGGTTPRVIDDLFRFGIETSHHTSALRDMGLRSSLTVPMNGYGGQFLGFVFFNSPLPGFFSREVVFHLLPIAEQAMRHANQLAMDHR